MKRIGIVGAGFITNSHAEGIAQFDNVELAGFTSIIRSEAVEQVAKYGGKVYESLDEMLGDPSIDIFDVCVPTHLHEEIGMKILDAGRPLLLEKPIARSKEAAVALVNKAEASGTPFMVAQSMRFSSAYMIMKDKVDAGEIGDVKMAYASRLGQPPTWGDGWYHDPKKSGGVIFNLTLHDYDYLRSLLGPIDSVFGMGVLYKNGGYEDVMGSVMFKSGAKAVVDGSLAMTPGFPFTMHMRIDGTQGTLEYTYKGGVNLDDNASEKLTLYKEGQPAEDLPCGSENPYGREISYFADCIERGIAPAKCNPQEMLEVIDMLNGILTSIETKSVVQL